MPQAALKSGRPALYGARMLPVGITKDLDEWLAEYASDLGTTKSALRRNVLLEFRLSAMNDSDEIFVSSVRQAIVREMASREDSDEE